MEWDGMGRLEKGGAGKRREVTRRSKMRRNDKGERKKDSILQRMKKRDTGKELFKRSKKEMED